MRVPGEGRGRAHGGPMVPFARTTRLPIAQATRLEVDRGRTSGRSAREGGPASTPDPPRGGTRTHPRPGGGIGYAMERRAVRKAIPAPASATPDAPRPHLATSEARR